MVLAHDILSFDASAAVSPVRPGLPLGEHLEVDEPMFGAALRYLSVSAGDATVLFRTRAGVRMLRLGDGDFWRLPALFAGRCAPWLCGFAVLDAQAQTGSEGLAVWIDLQRLSRDLAGN